MNFHLIISLSLSLKNLFPSFPWTIHMTLNCLKNNHLTTHVLSFPRTALFPFAFYSKTPWVILNCLLCALPLLFPQCTTLRIATLAQHNTALIKSCDLYLAKTICGCPVLCHVALPHHLPLLATPSDSSDFSLGPRWFILSWLSCFSLLFQFFFF